MFEMSSAMNHFNDINDEEFIPFLNNLGVETYKKSFEWMLNDPDFAQVLRWIYNSLDENNTLSAREEYRYTELENRVKLMSLEELEETVALIQEEYEGLCLPGDKDCKDDVKNSIRNQKERLAMLEKHEEVLNDLITQNEMTKEELNVQLTKLNAAVQQCSEDERVAGEECVVLAEEVESTTSNVMEIVADALCLYGNCHSDKETAKKFYTFGLFESYRQTQALFKSHFDLYTSKKFNQKQNDSEMDDDIRIALIEAKTMEQRLMDALSAYTDTKAELCGEQAKLNLVANFNSVHPSQITVCSMEAQSAIELLEQEEAILDQEMHDAIRLFVDRRTRQAVETTARSALAVREQIHGSLQFLHKVTQQAAGLDRAVYCCLRGELRAMHDLLHFASQLRQFLLQEAAATACRLKSMSDICNEQDIAEQNLSTSDILLNTLVAIFSAPPTTDALLPVKLYGELKASLVELSENIQDGFRKKEESLLEIKRLSKPLRDYIWDGCTKQPNCVDRSLAALTHTLRHQLEHTDERVVHTSGLFNSVKNGDKHNLRKLWQWFLTDQGKFLAAIKNVQ